MNKKPLTLIIVIAVILIGAVFFTYSFRQNMTNRTPTMATSSTLQSVVVYAGAQDLDSLPQPYVDSSTQTTILFKGDDAQAYRTLGADVYVNGKKVGTVSGLWFWPIGFSQDGKYFAVRIADHAGLANIVSYIYVINLNATTSPISLIKPKVQSSPYTSVTQSNFLNVFIASATWGSGDNLDVVSYDLSSAEPGPTTTIYYYQASPEETWQYDLITGSSTLISITH